MNGTTHIHLKATLSENVNKVFRLQTKWKKFWNRQYEVRNIPVIINNFNRLTYLQQQIQWLADCGHHNIHVIDNASTYAPLLEYYQTIPATVYFLNKNMGHEALWRTHIYDRFAQNYYVYTDPDVLPAANTPTDFMQFFVDVLREHEDKKKVGFGLVYDDLPNHYPKKMEVIQWESKLYDTEITAGLYHSKIDTTFALYRPGAAFQCWEDTIRAGSPYMLRHLPWYEDPNHIDEETGFYIKAASEVSSWYKTVEGKDERYNAE